MLIKNASVVTQDAIVEGGVEVKDGVIKEVFSGGSESPGLDFEGDWLFPGMVELHTDNLERNFSPRPGVRWPADAAMLVHDTQMASAGVTTVCDAVFVGFHADKKERVEFLKLSLDALHKATDANCLKTDHYLHLRCEISDPHCAETFGPLVDEPGLKIVSLMDHTPGQRQWYDIERYRSFHKSRMGVGDEQVSKLIERRLADQGKYAFDTREQILQAIKGKDVVLASHDDTTEEHIAEAKAIGTAISEFPTSLEAAACARANDLHTIFGAPNIVLGGSHSGNVSAIDAASAGCLDSLSSDYMPHSLLHAAFLLMSKLSLNIWEVANMVALHNAKAIGLNDRGSIMVGKKADFLRVRRQISIPAILGVWKSGTRIA